MLPVNAVIVRDVISIVTIRRFVEWLKPHTGDPETLKVIEPSHQPFEIADAVTVGILILLDVQAVDHRTLVPKIVDRHRGSLSSM
jgi:hypothetical protein